jgi:hypothetical protein
MAIAVLNSDLDWSFTNHVRRRAAERGISVPALLQVLADPEVTYAQTAYGPGRHVFQRGDVGVVVHLRTRTVITVLFRHDVCWARHFDSAEVAA